MMGVYYLQADPFKKWKILPNLIWSHFAVVELKSATQTEYHFRFSFTTILADIFLHQKLVNLVTFCGCRVKEGYTNRIPFVSVLLPYFVHFATKTIEFFLIL